MTPSEEASHWLFNYGLRNFMDLYDWKEAKCRNLIAKWMHVHGPVLAAQAVRHILDKKPLEPASRAQAWFAAVHDKEAKKNKPGHRPVANLPPVLEPHERADPDRVARKMAAFRREMEEM